jgi:hypothetical protein
LGVTDYRCVVEGKTREQGGQSLQVLAHLVPGCKRLAR